MGKFWKMTVLSLMIFYDASLHWVEILDITNVHPFYPIFPLFGFISYDLFWTAYWTLAFLLSLWIIFGKNKNK
jgi:hypothetical protein